MRCCRLYISALSTILWIYDRRSVGHSTQCFQFRNAASFKAYSDVISQDGETFISLVQHNDLVPVKNSTPKNK